MSKVSDHSFMMPFANVQSRADEERFNIFLLLIIRGSFPFYLLVTRHMVGDDPSWSMMSDYPLRLGMLQKHGSVQIMVFPVVVMDKTDTEERTGRTPDDRCPRQAKEQGILNWAVAIISWQDDAITSHFIDKGTEIRRGEQPYQEP
ncbi:hypothetical protein STEG23_011304 [Scotinomys teguina]